MYNYEWDAQTGGFILNTKMAGVTKELRPVFFEELDLLGFSKYWKYPKTDNPLLWAETRRYIYKGRLVAEAAGGGLFTAPELKIYEDGLELEPVDVDGMVVKNRDLMSGVVQNTLEIIYNTFKRYKERKYDIFYVAFSGGKDSLVLLDLVQRALPHNEFKVVFADTTMEVSDTYKAVEEAKKCWPTLEFHTARSDYDAKESWELFGPPSIKQRWCCSVHKSAPSLLLLRKLIGKDNLKALVFDGVRAEESDARAAYSLVSDGTKHVIQSNCSPLRDWNSSELFLYILENDLLMNKMYRQGSIRVGCMMCPMSSKWQQFILNTVYKSDVTPFLNIIDKNAKIKISSQKERKNYLENRGWKSRVGGRDLKIGGNRIVEQYENNILTLYVNEIHCNWRDWIKPLGDLIESNRNNYVLIYRDQYYQFSVNETNRRIIVSLHIGSKTKESIRFVYLFKNVFYKVAYCIGCKVCMVECPVGALSTDNNGVTVKNSCKHCESCLDMPKGCLVAKSLYITERGAKMNSKGINRYQTFGFRKEWLMYFYEMADRFWESRGKGRLGPYMFDGFKVWLKEAEITENNSLTQFGREIERLGVNDIRVWAIILNNLTYNSTIMIFSNIYRIMILQNITTCLSINHFQINPANRT